MDESSGSSRDDPVVVLRVSPAVVVFLVSSGVLSAVLVRFGWSLYCLRH